MATSFFGGAFFGGEFFFSGDTASTLGGVPKHPGPLIQPPYGDDIDRALVRSFIAENRLRIEKQQAEEELARLAKEARRAQRQRPIQRPPELFEARDRLAVRVREIEAERAAIEAEEIGIRMRLIQRQRNNQNALIALLLL